MQGAPEQTLPLDESSMIIEDLNQEPKRLVPLSSPLGERPRDPDRTSQIKVNFQTGEVRISELSTPVIALSPSPPSPTVTFKDRRRPSKAKGIITALVATTAAALGATAGAFLTLALLG